MTFPSCSEPEYAIAILIEVLQLQTCFLCHRGLGNSLSIIASRFPSLHLCLHPINFNSIPSSAIRLHSSQLRDLSIFLLVVILSANHEMLFSREILTAEGWFASSSALFLCARSTPWGWKCLRLLQPNYLAESCVILAGYLTNLLIDWLTDRLNKEGAGTWFFWRKVISFSTSNKFLRSV